MNEINSFSFFKDYYDVLKELPEEIQGKLLISIMNYVFEDKEPELTGLAKGIWSLLKRPLDTSKLKSKQSKKKTKSITEEKRNENETKTKQKRNENETISSDPYIIDRDRDREIDIERDTDISFSSSEKSQKRKTEKEEKIHFAEFVKMTNAEYSTLSNKYSKEFADQCIDLLNNYKGSSGKIYKSDYRAILTWVVNEVTKRNNQNMPYQKKKVENQRQERNFDGIEDLME